mgnify:CR=1 FL=1
MTTYEFATDALKEPGFITNFRKEDLALYQQALLEVSNSGLYISPRAYDQHGRELPGYFSLWQREGGPSGLSQFWELLNALSGKRDATESFTVFVEIKKVKE